MTVVRDPAALLVAFLDLAPIRRHVHGTMQVR
jgi:hypothetical protein